MHTVVERERERERALHAIPWSEVNLGPQKDLKSQKDVAPTVTFGPWPPPRESPEGPRMIPGSPRGSTEIRALHFRR